MSTIFPAARGLYTADDERLVEVDLSQNPPAETWSVRGLGGRVLWHFERRRDENSSWQWTKDYVHRSGQLLASVSPDGIAGAVGKDRISR